MSDRIKYRTLVVSIGRQLSSQEIQQIAFIRLVKEDITKYSPQNKDVTGIDLLSRLESLGQFSQENVDGLTDIVKDVNRADLVEEIKAYKRNSRGRR